MSHVATHDAAQRDARSTARRTAQWTAQCMAHTTAHRTALLTATSTTMITARILLEYGTNAAMGWWSYYHRTTHVAKQTAYWTCVGLNVCTATCMFSGVPRPWQPTQVVVVHGVHARSPTMFHTWLTHPNNMPFNVHAGNCAWCSHACPGTALTVIDATIRQHDKADTRHCGIDMHTCKGTLHVQH